jgi:hypothetical protein
MEGGNADIAGANICPYILYIAAPPSLALCVIPYILYIKKARNGAGLRISAVGKAFRLLPDR